jgi:sugar (pentulose or hexulose) kinase
MNVNANSKDSVILTIDAGTQSIRAAVVDLAGSILKIVKSPIEPYFSKNPGWAEQEPEYYWKMFCHTCQALLSQAPDLKEKIGAVSVTTQRATVVNVDKEGNSLRPAITWLDDRKADASKIRLGAWSPVLKAPGLKTFIEGVIGNCESNWIRQNQPGIWEKTHKYLLLSGYFNFKLTGEFKESTGSNVGYLPINNKTYQWAGKYDFKWKIFPVEPSKLPDLIKPGQILGQITQKAAQETGIPKGLPVIAAASDKACEILGAGCTTPETACLSFGTIATINTATKKYVEVRTFFPPYPAAIPDTFYTEISIMRGFWMVSWFKEQFGQQEITEGQAKGITPEMLFENLIKNVPPGSMGLVLNPHWMPEPNMERYAKGAIIGFGEIHTRAHFYRAIIEGLIFGLKKGAQVTAKKNKVPIVQVRVSGGGSQSDTAMQTAADIFGVPAQRPHTHETSAIGAAIDAAVGLKLFPDFESAVKQMARIKDVFEPIPKNHKMYQALYERVYTKIYDRLLPLYKEIQEITGYPE